MYLLSFRDESRDTGGPVLPGRLLLWERGAAGVEGNDAVAALAIEPRVTFLLHGFNVSRDEGRRALLRFAAALEGQVEGALVATIWPGDHWMGAAGYSFEGRDADDTACELARFIGDTLEPGTPISFASHSLGARVALETMDRLLTTGFAIDQVCLMAPAVDDDSLANDDVYRACVEGSGRIAVLHSNADRVLRLAYPAGDWLQSFLFFRADDAGKALGYDGPQAAERGGVPSNVMKEAVGEHGVGHGDYLPDSGVNEPAAPAPKSESAGHFAGEVLSGAQDPAYPAPGAAK